MTVSGSAGLRLLYLIMAAIFTACTLSTYAGYLQQYIAIRYSFYFELAMVFGQLVFQSLFLLQRSWRLIYGYLFQLLTVSLLGSLALWLIILLQQLVIVPPVVCLIFFLAVVAFMFFEHRRRLRKVVLPMYLSYTWLLYRSLILIFIL